MRLWDRQGKPIGSPFRGHQAAVRAIAISRDARIIASGSDDRTVQLWDFQGKPIGPPFLGHEGYVSAVAISSDGQTIVSGGRDKSVRLSNRQGKSIGLPFLGHEGYVSAVAISPDGHTILSGSRDGTVRLWRVSDWQTWLQIACKRLQHHPVLQKPKTEEQQEARDTCQNYLDIR